MSDLTNVFTDIADAIRAKTQTQITYKPTEMANAIGSISTGTASTAYCWKKGTEKFYFNFDKAVAVKSDFESSKTLVERFIEWANRTSGVTGNPNSVCYSEELNLFVIVGSSGTILTSPDGITWTSQTSGVTTILNSVCYSEELGLFVIVGNSGAILTSSDGITWTSQTSGITATLRSACYSEELGLFVIVGDSGTILTSSDGITWTSRTSGVTVVLASVCYSEELDLFVTVGNNGAILTSSDGITWTTRTSDAIVVLNSVCYSERLDLFVTIGESGAILTSRIKQDIISNIQNYFGIVAFYTKTSDSEFAISSSLQTGTFVRSANDDLDFWS